VSPAEIEAESAVLVTTTSGQFTVMVVGPTEPPPELPVVNEAEFETDPQFAADVGDVMCTERLVPEPARLVPAPPQVSALSGSAPENEHVQPEELEAIVQLRAPPEGRGESVIVTFVAVPVPLFVIVMVYPIDDPAETGDRSAALVIEMVGQLTVMLAVEELFPVAEADSFVADTEAVLEIEGHFAAPAVPETWMV
jgi:hypothetical protein